jgi:hypothetical protein
MADTSVPPVRPRDPPWLDEVDLTQTCAERLAFYDSLAERVEAKPVAGRRR